MSILLILLSPRPWCHNIPLLMLIIGRNQPRVRWIQLCIMELGKLFCALMGANIWSVNGSLRKNLRPDGTIEKYKEEEIFFCTYSPVA